MNKKFFLIALLYILPAFARDEIDGGIKIDFPGLSAFDHTGIINIANIADFRAKTHRLMHHKLDKVNMMADFVSFEKEGKLSPQQIEKLSDIYIKEFLKLSQEYFHGVRQLKPVLVKLITTWAHQRKLENTLVLLWASIETGKEEQFVKEYAPTLKAFYTFLSDIDMLLQDIMCSCPKTYAHYLECKKVIEEKHQHNA